MDRLKAIRSQNAFSRRLSTTSVGLAFLIILLWGLVLYNLLQLDLAKLDAGTLGVAVLGFLLMTHLYTGLFITAHDAMHGIVSKNKSINYGIGTLCALLFSFNFYSRLNPAHHKHHQFVGTELDPDYHPGSFFKWYLGFALQYVTIWQILLMALTYNLLKLILPMENLIVFWMLPAVASTFQLFYFGTYLPHKGEHKSDDPYKSNPKQRNHVQAFLSCYFFGYHYEHHAFPATPWWLLWRVKDQVSLAERASIETSPDPVDC